MALDLIISSISYNSDATEATIPDNTVYGSPNADREDVAVFLLLWKMDEDENETEVEIDNDSPDTVTEWTFDSSTDGWYKAQIIVIPNWDILTAYTVGQVVYYTNGSIYICILNSTGNLPTNTTYFSPIEITDTDITEADNVTSEYQDYLVIEQGKICAGEAAADWYKEQDCSNCKKTDFASSMFKKRAMIIAAQRYAAISLYAKAEAVTRKLETACESC